MPLAPCSIPSTKPSNGEISEFIIDINSRQPLFNDTHLKMTSVSVPSQTRADGFGALTFKSLLWFYPIPMARVKQAQMPGRCMAGLVPEGASVRRRTPPTGGSHRAAPGRKAQGIGCLLGACGCLWVLVGVCGCLACHIVAREPSPLTLPCGPVERAAIRDQIHPTVVQSSSFSLHRHPLSNTQVPHPKSASPTLTRSSAPADFPQSFSRSNTLAK